MASCHQRARRPRESAAKLQQPHLCPQSPASLSPISHPFPILYSCPCPCPAPHLWSPSPPPSVLVVADSPAPPHNSYTCGGEAGMEGPCQGREPPAGTVWPPLPHCSHRPRLQWNHSPAGRASKDSARCLGRPTVSTQLHHSPRQQGQGLSRLDLHRS